ncbi:MAG: DUF4177 domain-containing protein [Acidobacteria bacterium]|nr:MAG: DUF4177 domain-containing protein [Acidobacteriota bacterium]
MRQYEYRVEEVAINEGNRDADLAESLNAFGRQGWRVVSLEVDPKSIQKGKRIKVLLERRAGKVSKAAEKENAAEQNPSKTTSMASPKSSRSRRPAKK